MAAPYSGVSITGYNSNPPSDDGSQTEANRVKWATIKTKLNDPVKTRTDDINTALIAAFAKMIGGAGITSTSINYTVLSTDQGKLVRASSGGITITTPDATNVDAPFVFAVLNDSTSDITFDGSGSQTIDGDANTSIPPNCGVMVFTDGTNWYTTGQNFQRTQCAPQGYLTLLDTATYPTSPVVGSDQTAKTAVYYRPYLGNLIPIPNGTLFNVREFTELTLTLVSNHVASNIYDVFVFDDPSSPGTLRIGTGPAWTTATSGSGARGTGAGTTELEFLKGIPVNKVAATMRNGSTTYSVSAKCAVYVGSIFMDGTNGQLSCHISFGQSRKWGVWNCYNRQPIKLIAGDPTSSWNYATNTWRASNNASANKLTVFSGILDESFDIVFAQLMTPTVSGDTVQQGGIGWNSTSSPSGLFGQVNFGVGSGNVGAHGIARYLAPKTIGIVDVTALERTTTVSGTATYNGGESKMRLEAGWRG